MKNMKKKGFTLVELLVVIAIVAILAAVSVVGYTVFINRANLSNDQAFVTQANTTLQAAAIPDGFATAGEAITALNRNGFQDKYNTFSRGYHYAYNLENNKMYLVDDKNNVVYPDDDVELSSLWGLYTDNRTSAIAGVNKYVALANITNSDHYNDVFANGSYTIDLNGCLLSVDATDAVKANVTANNGIVISGATVGEGVGTDYELVTVDTSVPSTALNAYVTENASGELVIENKVFTQRLNPHFAGKDIKFVNCVFYEDAGIALGDINDTDNKVTFENCQFINIKSEYWAIIVYRSISVIDCTFTGLGERGAIQVQEAKNADIEVEIKGCTFDGVGGDNYLIRFVSGNGSVKSVDISNCNFVALNKAKALVGFRNGNETAINATWTFTNNTFGEIPADKYVAGNATLNDQLKGSAK